MSMKNIIPIVILSLILCFSIAMAVTSKQSVKQNSLFNSADSSESVTGDAGEEPQSWKGVSFTALPVCRKGEEYSEGNRVLAVSGVYWGTSTVSMTITLNDFSQGVRGARLQFRGEREKQYAELPECFPGVGYRVTIPWKEDQFCLYDVKWNGLLMGSISKKKQFGNGVKLIGVNTVEYFSWKKKIVYVLNQNNVVLERLVIKGFGRKCIRFGAVSYKEITEL